MLKKNSAVTSEKGGELPEIFFVIMSLDRKNVLGTGKPMLAPDCGACIFTEEKNADEFIRDKHVSSVCVAPLSKEEFLATFASRFDGAVINPGKENRHVSLS